MSATNIIILISIILWLYLLSILKRGNLGFFYFLVGSVGLFMILITNVNYIKQPFISTTTYILGLFGDWSHTFEAFEEKGIFFINNKDTVMSLYLDLECSGIIEMLVFVSLVLFFPVFNKKQRILNAIKGCCFLYIFNFIRILLILIVLYFFGTAFYPLVHSFVGRIVFYILTIVLYFNVFTRSQIKKQKVGNFNYDN